MKLFLTRIPLFPLWPEQIEIDGVKILIKDSPLSPQMRRRLLKGLYETAERELVKTLILPGEQILEVGASVGIVTCFLASRSGDSGKIVSIEPNMSLKPHFERQLLLNGVKANLLQNLCCPLWKQSVPESLKYQGFLPSQNNLSGRITKHNNPEANVRWITAEAACSETGLEPTALVVDIEGTEAVWTEHPPHFPASLRRVIMEVHPHLIGVQTAGRVVQAVVNEGFQVIGIRSNVLAFERA